MSMKRRPKELRETMKGEFFEVIVCATDDGEVLAYDFAVNDEQVRSLIRYYYDLFDDIDHVTTAVVV